MKISSIGTIAVLTTAALAYSAPARADNAIVICSASLSAAPAAIACAGIGVVVHELVLADRPFGPNGEFMKVLMAPGNIFVANVQATDRESGEVAKVLRGLTGVSVRDINRHGIFGGPNSVFRKPFG